MAVDETSLRRISEQVGVSHATLANFLSAPEKSSEKTVRKLVRWRDQMTERANRARAVFPAPWIDKQDNSTRGEGEESPEEAVAHTMPDVSYLQPAARAYFEQKVGSWVVRKWPMATVAHLARVLVAPIEGYNTMRKVGQGFRELSDKDQVQALENQAEIIEEEYGPNGVMKR